MKEGPGYDDFVLTGRSTQVNCVVYHHAVLSGRIMFISAKKSSVFLSSCILLSWVLSFVVVLFHPVPMGRRFLSYILYRQYPSGGRQPCLLQAGFSRSCGIAKTRKEKPPEGSKPSGGQHPGTRLPHSLSFVRKHRDPGTHS